MNNVKQWFEQSEPDYYLFFLKAWIPFNAWYVNEYPNLLKKDTEIIKELQNNPNSKPKKIIENFLNQNNINESRKFKGYLADLYYNLESTPVNHNGIRLSFKNLSLNENPIKHKSYLDASENLYKVEKGTGYFQAYIEAKGGKVLLDFKKPLYDIQELKRDSEYLRIEKKQQKKISELFEEINPQKSTSIISNSTKKGDFILLDSENSIKIINDTDTVAKAIIKVVYYLRCMLFHGEITPNSSNKIIYQNAYYLLLLINKKLN